MIIRENAISTELVDMDDMIKLKGFEDILKNSIFFDLEHYVYKKPVCIGVFGCCYFDIDKDQLMVTQYMIENRLEAQKIVQMAKAYFDSTYEIGKKYIVTFSGNNDYTVINYLFKKYKIKFNFDKYSKFDIQDLYKEYTGVCTGLKSIEKKFDIIRETESISGGNLAKTFSKVIKDEEYIQRMPKEKIEKILLYNEQDVVNLYKILTKWNRYVTKDVEKDNENCPGDK